MSVAVGDVAPDFDLPGTGGRMFRLSEYRGRPVVLVFYPGDDSPVCTKQLNSYNNELDQFQGLAAQVLAISSQSIESHDRFSAKLGLAFPLLADVDKEVAGAFGTVGPLGFPRRSVFVIDGAGIIRYVHRAIAGLTFRSAEELVVAVKNASIPPAGERGD
jgi:thioredoxin-dependent peroxiredoxin